MGNSIYRFLCGLCAPSPAEHGLHGAHPAVAALGRDILSFGANSQVSCQLRISIASDAACAPCAGFGVITVASMSLLKASLILGALCGWDFSGSGRAEPARRLLQESAGELVTELRSIFYLFFFLA